MIIKSSTKVLRRAAIVILLLTALLVRQQIAAQSPPPLGIQPRGASQVQVAWPPGTNFNVLEEIFGFDSTNVWRDVPDAPSVLGERYAVTRDTTNGTAFYRLGRRGVPGVSTPPNPTNTASVLALNTFNDHGSTTAFLYTGTNPVQVGVSPGTIDPVRSSVLRGKVKKRDNSPLPGVRVAILNHPEYGYTFTRGDGMFDLAVNASMYILDFQAIGYCPAQRQEVAPIQDFHTLQDIVMVGMDPLGNPIAFGSNAPAQLAISTTQTDAAGTRTAKVFFPAGTCANVVLADGSIQPCSALTVRITEFTVGSNGPAAMPAPLPPTSAYTYCAEFSGDEAMNAGARSIQFNQRVWGYLDNFLDMPVGTLVPNGFYDRQKAAWVPDPNGLVIKILGVTNGVAQVDLDGSGAPADGGTLTTNEFSTPELQQLAASYAPGSTLWRMPMAHFTGIDWNFAFNLINHLFPNTPGDPPRTDPNDKTPNKYGTVNLTSQVFEEAVPLVGVPMALHYSSARVPGYRALAQAVFPVLGDTPIPDRPLRIEVHDQIAGVYQSVTNFESPVPFLTATVSWDGYDVYGRYVGGSRNASIEVDFVYSFQNYGIDPYACSGCAAVSNNPLFANYGQVNGGRGHADGEVFGAFFTRTFTIPDHRTLGLGGWSLTPHHLYDPQQHFLYLGDGTVLKPDRLGNGVGSLPGLDSFVGLGFKGVRHVAAAPDGTLFFEGYVPDYRRVFKRSPDGHYSFMSGTVGTPGAIDPYAPAGWGAADGQPFTKVVVVNVNLGDMKAGPDGSLYLRTDNAIVRIDPQGIVHVVLGMGPNVYPSDGSLARGAYCNSTTYPGSLAVGSDGTVYYDDFWNAGCAPGDSSCGTNFIRKIAPDGRIYTLMGQAGKLLPVENWTNEMHLPARMARLNSVPVPGLAVGPDSSVYVSVYTGVPYAGGIFKITPGGLVETVLSSPPLSSAGMEGYTNSSWYGNEGQLAANLTNIFFTAGQTVTCLTVAPDRSVLFDVPYGPGFTEIWRINPNGILERLAGRGPASDVIPLKYVTDGGNPLETWVPIIGQFAVGPDNSLTLVTQTIFPATSVVHIGPSLSGFTAQELQIPAEDASELYIFDAHGNHLRTLNGLTGSTNWVFSYDANNLVTDIRDANGLLTRIERNGAGQPTGIVGPYGQRTTFALDANGFLSHVVNPASEATLLTYTKGGLLSSITGPRNFTYSMTYDANGLVAHAGDPAGGATDFSHFDSGSGGTVSSVTTLMNTNRRDLTLQVSGDTSIVGYFPDGTFQQATLARGGAQSTGYSDGSIGSYDFASDPRFPKETRRLSSEIVQLPEGPTSLLTIFRSTTLSDPVNPFSIEMISNQMTLNGNVYTATYNGTNRVGVATTPEGRQRVTALDAQGRMIHSQVAGQTPVDIVYDALGRVIEADDTASVGVRRTTFTYDALGRLSTLIDPLNRTNRYGYDAAGRLQQLTLADGQVANFQIDSEFNLASVTPPGRPAHRFDYNPVGLVTNYTPPIVNGLNESVGYQYDADRELTQVSLPDGQNVVFNRGPGGRLDQLMLGAGPTLTYSYATNNGLPTNILSTTGDGLHLDYQGSVTTNTTWSGNIAGSVSLTLNSDFLPASQSVNGSAITNAYDRDLLLIQAGSLVVRRDPATGLITGTALGRVTDLRQFDDRGLLTNYVASVSGTSVWSATFGYDFIGRLTNKLDALGSTSRTFSYVYDVAGRLQQVWQNGVPATTYTYDANGNRITGNTETATYDAQDRVQSYAGASFGWSRNGDLNTRNAAGQTTTYTYDVRGALSTVVLPDGQQIEYVNDAAGRRIGKKVGGALQRGWLWNSDVPIAELDGNSTLALRFIYAADDTTPSFLMKGTNTYRLVSDERGSVRLVVNVADGSIAQELDYDEFGRVLKDTAPGFQPFGYAGGLYEPDTGLVRFGVRDYSAETGQWTARDPIDFEGGQLSLYVYAGNDPLNSVDPLGLGPYPASFAIVAKKPAVRKNAKNTRKPSHWPEIDREDKEQVKELIQPVVVGKGLEALGQGPTAIVTHGVEVIDKTSTLGGELLNSATGNALNRAQTAAKSAGNMQGPNSRKMAPINYLDWRSYVFW